MSEPEEQPESVPQPPNMGPMLVVMMLMLFLMINPGMREMMGDTAGGFLEPSIGFDGQYVVPTLLLAGLIMVFTNTVIRHFLVDWSKAAEMQLKMSSYQKALREARQSRNEARVRKLVALQPEMLSFQGEMMSNQMRPMGFTMLIAIPIFMWLYTFVSGLDMRVVSLPWAPYWWLEERAWFLPHWVVIYSLMSIPFGQALQRSLKLVSFGRELRKLDVEGE